MSKSVKLSDGSYLDTEGIYDVTQAQPQDALNAKLARLGQVLPTNLSTDNSWTSVAANELHDVASLTLPEGIWLVIGYFYDRVGYLRVMVRPNTYLMLSNGTHDGAISSPSSLRAVSIVKGNQTVLFSLYAMAANKTYTWGQDDFYWKFCAVCIG